MQRQPFMIMNPRSGGGKVGEFGLKDKAVALGAEVSLLEGPGTADVAALARHAVDGGADLLGVGGGDGTGSPATGPASRCHDRNWTGHGCAAWRSRPGRPRAAPPPHGQAPQNRGKWARRPPGGPTDPGSPAPEVPLPESHQSWPAGACASRAAARVRGSSRSSTALV